jgi:hypothetical protein
MVSPLGKASTVMRTRIQDIFATCAGLVQTQRKAPGRGTGRELMRAIVGLSMPRPPRTHVSNGTCEAGVRYCLLQT